MKNRMKNRFRVPKDWLNAVSDWKFYLGLTLLLGLGAIVFVNISAEISCTATGKQPIYQGRTGQQVVALTFNVDWGEEYLPDVMQILNENQASATFMVTGRWAKSHPELISSIAAANHEIGNHGYSHGHPNQMGRSELADDILRTEAAVAEICGQKTRLYAPPYGEFNERVIETADSLGYPLIMWSLDTVDWRKPQPATIVQRVSSRVEADFIVLMHPTEPTVQALPEILKFLQGAGYRLVTVSEIISEGG